MQFNTRKMYLGAFASVLLTASALSYAGPDGKHGKGSGVPPAEALEACISLAEGASCSFVGRGDKTVEGVCTSKKGQDDAVLTCAHAHKMHKKEAE